MHNSHTLVALSVVVAALYCTQMVDAQHPGRPISAVRPFTSVDDILNREAQAADTNGVNQFAEDIIRLTVSDQAGESYVNSLTDRLAKAELAARSAGGALVPEATVAKAFNELMKRIGAPSSVKTDEATIRRFRAHGITMSALSPLLSLDRNGTNCNPGEAVYLLHLLILSNGKLPDSYIDQEVELKRKEAQSAIAGAVAPLAVGTLTEVQQPPDASWLLLRYSTNRPGKVTIKLFSGVVKTLAFRLRTKSCAYTLHLQSFFYGAQL